jgi:hypothetical protein
MDKFKILIILITWLILITACSKIKKAELTLFNTKNTPSESIASENGGKFERSDSILIVETTSGAEYSGIRIKGKWNLSGYGNLTAELDNSAGSETLPFRIILENPNADLTGWNDGVFVCSISVPPGTSGKYTFKLPPKIPYPEIVKKLVGVRYTPYINFPYTPYFRSPEGKHTYPRSFLDPSNVVAVSVSVCLKTTQLSRKWGVKSVIAESGEPAELQPWMKLPPEKFFPFIDVYGQFKHKEWPGKIKSDDDLKKALKVELADIETHPGPEGWDQYGGWKNGPKQKATGHFYAKKYNGKWWMVDPEGSLFWSHGAVRVTPSSAVTPLDNREYYFTDLPAEGAKLAEFYTTNDQLLYPYYIVRGIKKTYNFSAANIMRKYGENWRNDFADITHRRFRSWGLNSIANSSDRMICMLDKTPYCDRIELQSPVIEGCPERGWWKFKDPFHPEFRTSFSRQLIEHKTELDDPWCFGFFVDNEIYWGGITSLAEWTLQSPEGQPAKIKMVKRLKKKYVSIKALNIIWGSTYTSWDELIRSRQKPPPGSENDCRDFTSAITEAYFEIIRDEFKKIAPEKLYMGCRFSGSNETVVRMSAKYCDIMSYNLYRYTLDTYKLPEGIDKPVLVGEFHFGALDGGSICPAMIPVENQEERAKAYVTYLESALRHPNIVGTHWFQYSDLATTGRFDGANCQVGFTDICDNPYPETIAKVRTVGYPLYEIRNSKQKELNNYK